MAAASALPMRSPSSICDNHAERHGLYAQEIEVALLRPLRRGVPRRRRAIHGRRSRWRRCRVRRADHGRQQAGVRALRHGSRAPDGVVASTVRAAARARVALCVLRRLLAPHGGLRPAIRQDDLLGDLRAVGAPGDCSARAREADRDLRRLRHPVSSGPLRRPVLLRHLPPAGAPSDPPSRWRVRADG